MMTTKKKNLYYPLGTLILIFLAAGLAFASLEALVHVYRDIFPDVWILNSHYPIAIRKEGHKIIYKFQTNRPAHWVSLRQIPKQVVGAVLMSEDASFFQHKGYSPEAIRAAWEHNRKPGVKIKRGGSTITQQVVKNLFLSPEKTMTRKIRELLLAVELERRFSKAKILETYLNIAEWGPGIYGISNASQVYFKKPVSELNAKDGATLAFMLPNPAKYRNSIKDGEMTDFASKRIDSILERMWKTGKISDEEFLRTDQIPPSNPAPEEIPSTREVDETE